MKTPLPSSLITVCLGLLFVSTSPAQTPISQTSTNTNTATTAPSPTNPEERFKTLFTKANLSGRWAPLRDGQLGEERGGDTYHIVGVTKGAGDTWIVQARMRYRDQELMLPIPVQMKFVGDTAIMEVNNLPTPGGNTYTARLLIYERTYSGTWKGQRGGGMLYGTITNEE